jgi:hypothetical protein
LAKESVRDICLTDDSVEAKVLLDEAIVGCKGSRTSSPAGQTFQAK